MSIFDIEDTRVPAMAVDRIASRPRTRPRLLTTIDAEADQLRANVQDAARAVLTWVAAVVDHEPGCDLDGVLDRCLRPGPDVESVNYTALAQEINRTAQVNLSPKAVATAVRRLRESHQRKANQMQRDALRQKLEALHGRLHANYAALIDSAPTQHDELRRSVGVEVLGAVRRAAGRLIDSDYGEGIPQQIDIDLLESRFLDFVRDLVRQLPSGAGSPLETDLRRLLLTLGDYDRSAECDMRLVVDGGRVVADLMGPDSLPGVMAQLNVLVAGRSMLDSELYVAEMFRLADIATLLHEDAATKKLLNYIHRLPEEQRLPTPLRVASYCLNNAATHLFERLFRGEIAEAAPALEKAVAALERMRRRDSGFALIAVTQIIHLTTQAQLSGDDAAVRAHFRQLGKAKALELLESLIKFDNCRELVAAARAHAVAALPELKHQLIHLP